jgi:hypothetical protein
LPRASNRPQTYAPPLMKDRWSYRRGASKRRVRGRAVPQKPSEDFIAKILLALVWAITTAQFPAHSQTALPQESQATVDQARLPDIMRTAADYCERLKNMALYFVCHETILEKTYEFGKTILFKRSADKPPRLLTLEDLKTSKTVKRSYRYDYQMVKKGDRFDEKRDILEKNGKKRHDKNVQPETLRMTAKFVVFGPVGFLSKAWQPHFRYEIAGIDILGEKRAIVIRATPREVVEENYCFGRIWIDETDSSILQIEWEPGSIAGLKDTVASPIGELKRRVTWTVTYDVVKNAVRFPGSQLIKETYITKNGKVHTKYEAGYVYDSYKFFTVETEVSVR